MSKTVSLECKSCESDFLAILETDEHKLQICYRCFLNGMADIYLKNNSVNAEGAL